MIDNDRTRNGGTDGEDRAEVQSADPVTERVQPRYEFTQVDGVTRQGHELEAISADGETFAGAWVQDIFESACERPEQATWAGYVADPVRGVRTVPLEHEALFRHIGVFGTTGYGKSTLLINLMVQWSYAGFGYCFIDPKGDDILRLLQRLPENRLDDVIWIEPAPMDHDRVVGINFLEPGSTQSEAALEYEIESILSDLKAILRGEEYWGPTMNAIIENVGRAMIRSDLPYTILDMYFVLVDEDRRRAFAESVADDVVREYTQKIAEMDDDTIDPVLKRVQTWVENRISREIVAHRKSSVNVKEAVEAGKIILVRNTVDSEDMKRMVATGIMRRIWAAIKARERLPEAERTPYFMVVDEFDAVVSEDANVDTMLSRARSMGMSVTLANQHPSQLPEKMQKAIFANCDNLLAFNPNEPDDARAIMTRFGDYTTEDLLDLGRFKLFTRIMVNTERSEPFISHTFPPYPPLRSRADARGVIEHSLDQYGVDRLDPAEITNDLIVGAADAVQRSVEDALIQPESLGGTEHSPGQETVLESVFAVQIREEKTGDWVPITAVKDALDERVQQERFTSEVSNLIERVPEELVAIERREGTLVLKLTPEGKRRVFTQDTGRAASGGSDEHRLLLRRAFELFTRVGFTVDLLRQGGSEQPDGVATLPINPRSETLSEAKRKEARLREEYPVAYTLSGGRPLAIEAEATTLDKPMQTLTNLRKAIDGGRTCVFAVPDGESTHDRFEYWAQRGERILTDPPLVRLIDEDGNRTFYNAKAQLEVGDGVYAVRPAGHPQTVWQEDGDEIVMRDGDGQEHARFRDREHFANVSRTDVPASYTYNGKGFVVQADRGREVYSSRDTFANEWVRVRRPFIPGLEFSRQPTHDDWVFVVIPDDEKDRPPQIYEDGDIRPLIPTDGGPEPSDSTNGISDLDSQNGHTREATDQRSSDQEEGIECQHGNDPETCVWCNS